jgi:hypothetical protein
MKRVKKPYTLNSYEVEILDFETYHNQVSVLHAVYVDSGEELTDNELYELENKYGYELEELAGHESPVEW